MAVLLEIPIGMIQWRVFLVSLAYVAKKTASFISTRSKSLHGDLHFFRN